MARHRVHEIAAKVVLLGAALACAPPRSAHSAGLEVAFGQEGLRSLRYQGAELLADPAFHVSATGTDGKAIQLRPRDEANPSTPPGTVRRVYEGLTVTCTMTQERNTLRIAVAFRNTGNAPLGQVRCVPATLRFPARPKGGRWIWGYRVATENDGEPGIVEADWLAAKVVACVDEIEKPVTFGFEGNYGNSDVNAILIETPKRSVIKPLEERAWRFSLRFADSRTPVTEVARDIYAQFARAYPFTLNWPDRRPIGALFMCTSATGWRTNPRGWFNDPQLDVLSATGRKTFRERLMEYAERCIREMKEVGAQGMILWDVEGQEMPHAVSYLGDPRVLPRAAPEMDEFADEFFRRFRDSGLRTGVCIRPSRVVPGEKGGWKHVQVDDHVAEMSDKIAYAKKRWGCTIIYMDTNVRWEKGMWQGDSWLLPSRDLHELCRRHPDVLVFPEFGRFGYWGCCMPYGELRGGWTRTGDDVRAAYPKAGTVIAAQDGDYLGNWEALLAGVSRGDIHLFRGWFADPRNQEVKRLYREAEMLRSAASVSARTGPLETLLSDGDPAVRYACLGRARRLEPAQAALVARRLESEQDWVVQKKMIEALGESGAPEAVPVLAGFVRDASRGLDSFAAVALGRIGRPATQALLELSAAADQRIVERALLALAQYDDPAALDRLLELSAHARPELRSLAARALGLRKAPDATSRLVAMLGDQDRRIVVEACRALGRLKDRAAVKPLVETVERAVTVLKDNDVRLAAGEALEAITGLQHGPFEQRWRRALAEGQLR